MKGMDRPVARRRAAGSQLAAATAIWFGLATGVTPAAAQDNAASAEATGGIGDIVVTARRKEEALQSVPISVQAFSGETLGERNVQDATDLQRLVPSLTTYQQARDEVTLSIRGQSSSGASAQGQNPRVTAYFAQVPLQTGDTGPGRFFDLQNVQVLKGPQGTLFGRNSTGGAVLYEPARPTHDFSGYINFQYGRFDDRQLEGAINIPATDTLAFRFSAKRAKRDGFTTNIVNGEKLDDRNYLGLRGSMLFTPTDGFENFLMVDYLKSDTNGSSQQFAGYDPNKLFQADVFATANPRPPVPPLPLYLGGNRPAVALLQTPQAGAAIGQAIAAGGFALFPDPILPNQLANQIAGGPRIAQSTVDGLSKARGWGITNITTLNLGENLTLKNIFGYRRYKQLSRYDYDGTALPLLDQVTPDGWWSVNLRQISEELQLQGKALDDKLDFTVGGFLLWQKSPSPQRLIQLSVGTPSLSVSSPVERSQALFGQINYDLSDIVADGFSITAGYRYTHDYRSVDASNYRDARRLFPASTCSLVRGCPTFTEASFNASSYNIGLDYQVTPDTLLYVTHRRGYRAGGLNPQALDFGVKYGPEKVIDFEAGLKADFELAGMKARTNVAAFYSELKDAQVSQSFSTINPVTQQLALINLIVNAAKAKIKGLEVDATLVPFENFTLGASYALTDAKYTSFVDVQTGAPITNRPFPFLAKHRLNLSANYVIPVSDTLGKLSLSANWAYSSSYSLSVFPDPLGVENGYNQLDLRADLTDLGTEGFSLGVFVNNATNEVYKIGGVPIFSVLGTTSVLYNEPRTWGIQARYRFGS